MNYELEKAQLLFKLARNKTWNNVYGRLEHFKRFQHFHEIVKELSRQEWILIHKKANYTGISVNTRYKKEIIDFIEMQIPHLKGYLS